MLSCALVGRFQEVRGGMGGSFKAGASAGAVGEEEDYGPPEDPNELCRISSIVSVGCLVWLSLPGASRLDLRRTVHTPCQKPLP